MKNRKYKILVLSDMKESTTNLLQSTIGLANMIDGDISFFHVKKPTEVVKTESQLSAVRTINEQYNTTDKKIKEMLGALSNNHNFKINYTHTIGNIKDEIGNYIEETAPDVIVLGKRKTKVLSFAGDNVTDFVLKKHEGAVVIASNQNILESNEEFTVGVLNDIEDSLNKNLAQSLIENAKEPLKSFQINGYSSSHGSSSLANEKKTVEYIFEDNSNTMKTISDYVSKNNISLLCIDRGNGNSKKASYVKDAISKVNASLLVT